MRKLLKIVALSACLSCLIGIAILINNRKTKTATPRFAPYSFTTNTQVVERYTGLRFNFSRVDGKDADMFITNGVAVLEERGISITPRLVTVIMSCGNQVTFGKGVSIPNNDVACPCGKTNHWLWKFSK